MFAYYNEIYPPTVKSVRRNHTFLVAFIVSSQEVSSRNIGNSDVYCAWKAKKYKEQAQHASLAVVDF